MRIKGTAGIALSVVMVLALAGVAVASGVLGITPVKSVVSYPTPAKFIVTTPAAVAETVTVQARPSGTTTWTVIKSFAPSEAALATTFTVVKKLRVNSDVMVSQGVTQSAIATVGVKAKVTITRASKRKSGYTVYGMLSPAHGTGSVVGLHVWKRTGKGKSASLVAMDDLTGSVYKYNKSNQQSWWKVAFTPGKGTYVIQAFHEDNGHVLSVAKKKTVTVR